MRPDDDIVREDVADALARSSEPMSDAARARTRRQVMRAVRSDSRAHFFAAHSRRVAAAMTAVCVLGSGVAYAASSSHPGEPLYAVKRATEDVVIALLPPGGLEHGVLVGLAGRRAGEAAYLASEGATSDVIDATLAELRDAVAKAARTGDGLGAEELQRIEQQAAGAPAPTRDAVSDVVSPDAGGSQGSGSGNATPGTQGGTGGQSGDGGSSSGETMPGNPDVRSDGTDGGPGSGSGR